MKIDNESERKIFQLGFNREIEKEIYLERFNEVQGALEGAMSADCITQWVRDYFLRVYLQIEKWKWEVKTNPKGFENKNDLPRHYSDEDIPY